MEASIAAYLGMALAFVCLPAPSRMPGIDTSPSPAAFQSISREAHRVTLQDAYKKERDQEQEKNDKADHKYWIKRKLELNKEAKYKVEGALKEVITLPNGMANEVSSKLTADLLLKSGEKLEEECGSLPFTLTVSRLIFVSTSPSDEDAAKEAEKEREKIEEGKKRDERKNREDLKREKEAKEKADKEAEDKGRTIVLEGLVDEQNAMTITDQKGLRREDQDIAGLVARMAQGIGTFPDEPVKIGDTWTVADQQSFLGNKKLEYTLKLESQQKIRGLTLYYITTDTTLPIEIGVGMGDDGEPIKTGMVMRGTLRIFAQAYVDQNGLINSLVFQTQADVTMDSPDAGGQIKLSTDETLKIQRKS